MNDVKCIDLATGARGKPGACLDDESGVAGNAIAAGGEARMEKVDVPGKKDVGAAMHQFGKGADGTSDNMPLFDGVRKVKWMMRYDDFQ